jgi:hypothetical protein
MNRHLCPSFRLLRGRLGTWSTWVGPLLPTTMISQLEVVTRLKVIPLTVRRWPRASASNDLQVGDRASCRIRETDVPAFLDAHRRGGVQERAQPQPLAP